jgi:hypothetical protein
MTWNERETRSEADWAFAAAARGQTPELMREALRDWVERTDVWIGLVPGVLGPMVSADFSRASLDSLWHLLDRAEDEEALREHAVRYLGETVRRLVHGAWTIDLDPASASFARTVIRADPACAVPDLDPERIVDDAIARGGPAGHLEFVAAYDAARSAIDVPPLRDGRGALYLPGLVSPDDARTAENEESAFLYRWEAEVPQRIAALRAVLGDDALDGSLPSLLALLPHAAELFGTRARFDEACEEQDPLALGFLAITATPPPAGSEGGGSSTSANGTGRTRCTSIVPGGTRRPRTPGATSASSSPSDRPNVRRRSSESARDTSGG